MAHLSKIRRGWENENLARFILSKFSFISQPVTIGDDLGVDFFCTFFERVEEMHQKKGRKPRKEVFILPTHSFAIQIKSNRKRFRLTDKLIYLDRLAIPYFIGVVNQNKLSVAIYSGDEIPELFSHIGLPPRDVNAKISVDAVFFEEREDHVQKPRQTHYFIPFYYIGEIQAIDSFTDMKPFLSKFSNICINYHNNIITKMKQEFLFHGAEDSRLNIIAGSGSFQVFRNNFLDRLAEVFCNLAWFAPQVPNNQRDAFIRECNFYTDLYKHIEGL